MSRLTTGRITAAVVGLSTAVTGLAFAPAHAATTDLVINEVYGAGGNAGAVFNADFVELYNPTDDPISLTGLSVQYRSANGGSGGSPYALTGSVPANGTFLIQMSSVGANGAALPTPDATASPSFTMAAAGGQTFLLAGTTPISGTGDMSGNPAVIDMVGVSGSTSYETAPTTVGATATNSLNRNGGADTDNNATDFTLAAPTPTASGSGGGTDPDPEPPTSTRTIAEIQGTGATSPLNGQNVTTQGVVTATYPTGGLNGFYIQTAGTGGATDATPGASDAIFVYSVSGAGAVNIGDHVQVTGAVTEYAGTTEITAAASDITKLAETGAVTPLATAYPTTEADREAHEGELLAPTDRFTVTNNYTTNQYGEIGLATGDTQLWQPTDRADAQDTAAIAAIQADNAARAVTLDDGSSWNYLTTYKNTPMPWLTPTNPVRIGSAATLQAPVILEFRNNVWKFQPQSQVTDAGTDVATFSDTRAENQAPREVGGDVKLATMNVLNYFNTTGEDWIAAGGTCSFYNDRAGDPVTDNTCSGGPTGQGPRGAAESTGGTDLGDPDADLERQRTKIVKAINTLDADIVSLEEIENSIALGEADRDDALRSLVTALNAAAGSERWAYVPSPPASELPPLAEQDVIRTAFIYDPSTVETVGDSEVLVGAAAFDNAREPLAQAFKRIGARDADAFAVIVNHFKSKGSGVDDGTGQGNANPDRIAQANALVAFADRFKAERGVEKVFLTGDFNSYTMEDPIQVLEAAGYTNLESDDERDTSYEFGGMAGSLDHVLANEAALPAVTGVDVWQINAEESVAFEYSRYNYNATLLYQDNVFRASDHNPEVIGVAAPYSQAASTTSVSVSPAKIQKKKSTATVTATVSTEDGPATGEVQFLVDGVVVATATLVDGRATTVVGPYDKAGLHTVTVRYAGSRTVSASEGTAVLEVTNGKPKL